MNEVRWWWVFFSGLSLCVYLPDFYCIAKKCRSLSFYCFMVIVKLHYTKTWIFRNFDVWPSSLVTCCAANEVRIVQSVKWLADSSIPDRGRRFFSLRKRPGRLWGSPASCAVSVLGSFPFGKEAGARSWPSSYGVEVKNSWRCTSTPLYNFLACMGKILPFVLSRTLAMSSLRINNIPDH